MPKVLLVLVVLSAVGLSLLFVQAVRAFLVPGKAARFQLWMAYNADVFVSYLMIIGVGSTFLVAAMATGGLLDEYHDLRVLTVIGGGIVAFGIFGTGCAVSALLWSTFFGKDDSALALNRGSFGDARFATATETHAGLAGADAARAAPPEFPD